MSNRWLGQTAASEEKNSGQLRSVSNPYTTPQTIYIYICKGRRLANMGAFKLFMGQATFTGADLIGADFWPKPSQPQQIIIYAIEPVLHKSENVQTTLIH
jgi:hypothetical protein